MEEVEDVVYVGDSDLEIVCGVAGLLELVPREVEERHEGFKGCEAFNVSAIVWTSSIPLVALLD